MNYEEKYKKALERARDMMSYKEVRREDMEYLFPELKESEDEKIRKQIISFLKEFEHDHYRSLNFSSWIAWLEKQGEQKPTDKVESKFHEGDWVVTDKGDTVQIGTVNNDYYTIGNGMLFSIPYVDTSWHLWTIEDAKDGDVLVSANNQPFIYNGKFTEYTVGAYCGLNVYDVFVVEKYLKESNWTNNDNIRLATKEQRNILMKEIHRANFKWDADKKELKNCKL